jgi:hypothetical protein
MIAFRIFGRVCDRVLGFEVECDRVTQRRQPATALWEGFLVMVVVYSTMRHLNESLDYFLTIVQML